MHSLSLDNDINISADQRLLSMPKLPEPIPAEQIGRNYLTLDNPYLRDGLVEEISAGLIPYAIYEGGVIIPFDWALVQREKVFAFAACGGNIGAFPQPPQKVDIRRLPQPLCRIGPAPIDLHLKAEPLKNFARDGFQYAEYKGEIYVWLKTVYDVHDYDDDTIFDTVAWSDLPSSEIVD